MTDVMVRLEHVTKHFVLRHTRSMKEAIVWLAKGRKGDLSATFKAIDDLDLAIDGDQPNAADQLVVAGAIDRIRGVVPVSGLSEASLSGLLASSPRALVVPPKLADEISARFAQKAVLAGCDLVVFDDDSVALTIDNRDRVTVRQRTTATR